MPYFSAQIKVSFEDSRIKKAVSWSYQANCVDDIAFYSIMDVSDTYVSLDSGDVTTWDQVHLFVRNIGDTTVYVKLFSDAAILATLAPGDFLICFLEDRGANPTPQVKVTSGSSQIEYAIRY